MAASPADDVNRAIVEARAALVRLDATLRTHFGTLRTIAPNGLERGAVHLVESFAKSEIDAMCRRLNELQHCADLVSARLRGSDVEREVARLREAGHSSENKS